MSDIKSFLDELKQLNEKDCFDVFVTSIDKKVPFKALSVKQHKDIVRSLLGGVEGTVLVTKIFNDIILENSTQFSDFKLYDRNKILVELRKQSISDKVTIDDKDYLLSELPEYKAVFKVSSEFSYKGIDVKLTIPSLELDSKITEKSVIEISKFTSDEKKVSNSINILLAYEIMKFIETIKIDDTLITFSELGTYDKKNIIENLRAVKDLREIEAIKRSVNVTRDVLKKVTGKIRPGISEQSISDSIECEFIKRGARIAFETITACGRNCSKPHAHATKDRIASNDVVMLDMGCRLDLYNSDITRMVFIGKVKDKIKEIYGIVRAAQSAAIEKIKPGVKISEIDLAGRGYIARKGYSKFFGHSLGHGIGMDVHEEPSISKKNDNILKSGMVFTIEPAIYLPKLGGVRIEDMVLVTDKGCEVLTR